MYIYFLSNIQRNEEWDKPQLLIAEKKTINHTQTKLIMTSWKQVKKQ